MKLASSALVLGALTATSLAGAQPPEEHPTLYPPARGYTMPEREQPTARKVIPAAENAVELTIGSGYTQGFGSLKSGVGMPSVATGGLGIDLGVGYRIDPRWSVSWAGEYQELTPERAGSGARGFTTSIAAQYHFSPVSRVDPWVEIGAGYRFLWEDPSIGPTLLSHGWQLARVRAGLDLRADAHVAFGPMIGADATMFLFQDGDDLPTYISDPRLSTFIFAGVQGRFDIGGSTTTSGRSVAKR